MGYIKYKQKKYKTITIRLSKDSDFSVLLKEFHQLEFPELKSDIEHIRYAVLELVNNSIRAHKEQNTAERILLRFTLEEEHLLTIIKDAGGGFDISVLPYDINHDVSQIDLNAPSFQQYREENDYNRFGMGLLVTKRTFDDFNITFYTGEREDVHWGEENILGTIITLRSRYNEQSKQ